MNVDQARAYVQRLAERRGCDELSAALEVVAILSSTHEVIYGLINGQEVDGVVLVPGGTTWRARVVEWERSGGKHD